MAVTTNAPGDLHQLARMLALVVRRVPGTLRATRPARWVMKRRNGG